MFEAEKVLFGLFFIFSLLLSLFLFKFEIVPTSNLTQVKFEKASDLFYDYEIFRYPVRAKVLKGVLDVGINADPNILDFGELPLGSKGKKSIWLNNSEKEVKVEIKVFGEVRPFLKMSENSFELKSKESKLIKVEFYALKEGNFTGELDILIKKPKYSISLW